MAYKTQALPSCKTGALPMASSKDELARISGCRNGKGSEVTVSLCTGACR
uniref:Uncharacterized protein n=1 Tax=Aegilops tauschii TaxID=37682 RepID=M8C570_AEGTA